MHSYTAGVNAISPRACARVTMDSRPTCERALDAVVTAARRSVDPEARLHQLLESAQATVAQLRSGLPAKKPQTTVTAAVAIGRVLGFAEGISFVDADIATQATESTVGLV